MLSAGEDIYRVFSNGRRGNEFNPRLGGQTRFGFFGDPPVPILYGAQGPEAAVCETLLHEVPVTGGRIFFDDYSTKVMGLVRRRRDLRLASFMGIGLRRLKIEARDLTDTEASQYARTVLWAAAAHRAGFDGVVWMSRRDKAERAYALFGDRVSEDDLEVSADFGLLFESGVGLDWLINFCGHLHVEVMPAM